MSKTKQQIERENKNALNELTHYLQTHNNKNNPNLRLNNPNLRLQQLERENRECKNIANLKLRNR